MSTRYRRACAVAVAALGVLSCSTEDNKGGGVEPIPEGGLSLAVCDPSAGPFSTTIGNPFFPLPEGQLQVYEGEEEGTPLRLEIRVLADTEEVEGVTTRVVEERDFEEGTLVEVSRNFFAQAPDGTVCYFGEDVDVIADDGSVTHPGQWRAGGGNQPGIVMPPPTPAVGTFWSQEVAPGVAQDRAEVVAIGETITTPAGTFTDTIRTREFSPLEPDVEEFKSYARGVGLIDDNGVLLQPAQL